MSYHRIKTENQRNIVIEGFKANIPKINGIADEIKNLREEGFTAQSRRAFQQRLEKEYLDEMAAVGEKTL